MKHPVKTFLSGRSVGIILLLLSTVALSILPAGCAGKPLQAGTQQSASPTGAESPAAVSGNTPSWGRDTSEFKIDWYVNLSWWKWPGSYGNDYLSDLIRKKTGAVINFITPAGDGSQQLATMIAAGTLPDVMSVESWRDYYAKIAQGGYLWSMNELIYKYAPDFNDIIHKDIFDWYAMPDGKTYGLPNFAYSRDALKAGEKLVPNAGFTLRKDIYDRFGAPDTSNPDNFLTLLERVKKEYGTYKGKTVTPLQLYEFTDTGSQSVNWLAQYFSVPFEDPEGNYLDIRVQPKYFEVIKFLNDAYNRGLISPDNFSETREMINEKVASGTVFSMLTAPQDFKDQYKTLYQADSKAAYQVFTLQNYEGDRPYLSDISGFGWLVSCITRNAKQPERIIRLFEYLYSQEGQMDMAFGGKELYSLDDQGKVAYNPEIKKALSTPEGQKEYAFGFSLLLDWLSFRSYSPVLEKPEELASDDIIMKTPLIGYTYDGKLTSLKMDPGDSRNDAMLDLGNRIDLYWGNQLPKMIMAASESEARAVYDATITEMKQMGLDDLQKYDNDRFQLTKKALGVNFGWPGNIK